MKHGASVGECLRGWLVRGAQGANWVAITSGVLEEVLCKGVLFYFCILLLFRNV